MVCWERIITVYRLGTGALSQSLDTRGNIVEMGMTRHCRGGDKERRGLLFMRSRIRRKKRPSACHVSLTAGGGERPWKEGMRAES